MYHHYKIVPENPDECGPNCKRAQETIAQDFYDIVYKAQSKNTEDAELGPERVVYLVDKFKKEVEDFKKFENLFRMIINFFYSLYKEKKSVHQTADLEFLATSLPTGVVYQILNLLAEKIDDFAAENGGILTYDNNAKIKIYLYLGHYFYIRMENKDYNTDTNVRLKRMQKERSTQKGMDTICTLQETGTKFEALSSEQKAIVIKVTSGFEQFIGDNINNLEFICKSYKNGSFGIVTAREFTAQKFKLVSENEKILKQFLSTALKVLGVNVINWNVVYEMKSCQEHYQKLGSLLFYKSCSNCIVPDPMDNLDLNSFKGSCSKNYRGLGLKSMFDDKGLKAIAERALTNIEYSMNASTASITMGTYEYTAWKKELFSILKIIEKKMNYSNFETTIKAFDTLKSIFERIEDISETTLTAYTATANRFLFNNKGVISTDLSDLKSSKTDNVPQKVVWFLMFATAVACINHRKICKFQSIFFNSEGGNKAIVFNNLLKNNTFVDLYPIIIEQVHDLVKKLIV